MEPNRTIDGTYFSPAQQAALRQARRRLYQRLIAGIDQSIDRADSNHELTARLEALRGEYLARLLPNGELVA